MKVTDIELIEHCIDGSLMKNLFLDESIDEGLIHKLGETGKLDYYPNFPRPFFKIEREGYYIIKGVLNNNSIRVILDGKRHEEAQNELIDFINNI
jgi:hypothetical protein